MNWFQKLLCAFGCHIFCPRQVLSMCATSHKKATDNCVNIYAKKVRICKEVEDCDFPHLPPEPPPPPMNICQFPVYKTGDVMFWSPGCENAVKRFLSPHFTWEKWVRLVNEMALYVNGSRFFVYCLEEAGHLADTYIPVKKNSSGLFVVAEMDDEYVDAVFPRFHEYYERDMHTKLTLFSAIKGNRHQYTFWHPSRNTGVVIGGKHYETTPNHQGFITHRPTIALAKIFVKNYVRKLINSHPNALKNTTFEILNEPLSFKGAKLEKFYDEIIAVLNEVGVPNEHIAINFVGRLGSKVFKYLDKGVRCSVHGVNTPQVVKKYHSTRERWGLREVPPDKLKPGQNVNRYTTGSGDGGVMEDLGIAKGLKIWKGPEGNRKASSLQMYQMTKFDLSNGKIPKKWHLTSGHGIEFMSNSAFAFPFTHGYYYPNLTDAIHCAFDGLTREEAKELGVDYKWNKMGECEAIYRGYRERREG